jgi:hypothetical protein
VAADLADAAGDGIGGKWNKSRHKRIRREGGLDDMPDPGEPSPLFRRREVVFCDSSRGNVADLLELHKHVPVVWLVAGEDALVNVDHVSPDTSGVGQLAYEYLDSSG